VTISALAGRLGVREISGKFEILEMSGELFISGNVRELFFGWLITYKISKTTRKR